MLQLHCWVRNYNIEIITWCYVTVSWCSLDRDWLSRDRTNVASAPFRQFNILKPRRTGTESRPKNMTFFYHNLINMTSNWRYLNFLFSSGNYHSTRGAGIPRIKRYDSVSGQVYDAKREMDSYARRSFERFFDYRISITADQLLSRLNG